MKIQKTMPILPVEAYTSEKWFKEEQRLIFGNTWQFAGFIEDLKEPGDYITTQCGLQNILILKDKNLSLKAFHNLCRHRGTQLLRAVGKVQKAITCPYHDWTYNTAGQLISVPEKKSDFPDLELNKICLHKASVATWRGMIWVHPKTNVEPIESWFEKIEPHLGPHNPNRLIEYPNSKLETIIHANWKIVAENYMDVYHLSHLHSNTLHMYNHAKADYGFVGKHYQFKEPLKKKYKENLNELSPFKIIKEMENDSNGAYVPLLFPNLGLGETEASWSTFQIIPLAPDKTKVIVRTKLEEMSHWEYTKQSIKSYNAWSKIMGSTTKYGNTDKNDPMASGDFMEEDKFACEQQQKSLATPLFTIETTALHKESMIVDFQKIIAEYMKSND